MGLVSQCLKSDQGPRQWVPLLPPRKIPSQLGEKGGLFSFLSAGGGGHTRFLRQTWPLVPHQGWRPCVPRSEGPPHPVHLPGRAAHHPGVSGLHLLRMLQAPQPSQLQGRGPSARRTGVGGRGWVHSSHHPGLSSVGKAWCLGTPCGFLPAPSLHRRPHPLLCWEPGASWSYYPGVTSPCVWRGCVRGGGFVSHCEFPLLSVDRGVGR